MSAITQRRDMGLYEVPLSVSLLGFWMGTMLANFHMGGIMLLLRAVLNISMMFIKIMLVVCMLVGMMV